MVESKLLICQFCHILLIEIRVLISELVLQSAISLVNSRSLWKAAGLELEQVCVHAADEVALDDGSLDKLV